MLREGVWFNITAYLPQDKEFRNMAEDSLFSTLNYIQEDCLKENKEWLLMLIDKKEQKLEKIQTAMVCWFFVSSEETYKTIVEKFDQCEELNLAMFYINRS